MKNLKKIASALITREFVCSRFGKIARNIVADKENGFGLTDDGWDENDLEDLIELFNEFEKVQYEIKNARRGSYGIEGKKLSDLIEKLEELKRSLDQQIKYLENQEG